MLVSAALMFGATPKLSAWCAPQSTVDDLNSALSEMNIAWNAINNAAQSSNDPVEIQNLINSLNSINDSMVGDVR